MIIKNEEDIIKIIEEKQKEYKKNFKPKIDRLLLAYRIIREEIKKGEMINFLEWYYPRFYLEVINQKLVYPKNIRLSLSYDVKTGTLMNEVLNGVETNNFHGCVRGKHFKTWHKLERILNTKFDIPIRHRKG